MHQFKTVVQTLLFLSVLNLVFAAPILIPREEKTGLDRRQGTDSGTTSPGGTTPSSSPSKNSKVKSAAKTAGIVALLVGLPIPDALGVYWAVNHFGKHDKQNDQNS